jgi:hypothetical protein
MTVAKFSLETRISLANFSSSMMVKPANRHLLLDPFLAFHQCLMLILLSALLVVVYSNNNLLK